MDKDDLEQELERAMGRAEDLAKVAELVEEAVKGLPHDEKLSVLNNAVARAIINNDNEYTSDVIAEMTMSFIAMVTTYKILNDMMPDDDDDEDEGEGETRQ